MADGNRKETRSVVLKVELLHKEHKEVCEYEKKRKLPPGSYIIGCMMYLRKPVDKG